MSAFLWALVIPLLAIVSAVLLHKTLKLPVNTITNLVALGLTFLAVYVAIVSYRLTVEAAKDQQVSLDASRRALESVVSVARAQQDLLRQTLDTSQAQLRILQEQWKKEEERLARKPEVEISFGTVPWSVLRRNPTLALPASSEGWSTFTFLVVNRGNAPVVKPMVLIVAKPSIVKLDQVGYHQASRPNHNVYLFSGPNVVDLQPASLAGRPYSFAVDAWAPAELTGSDLEFSIMGENLKVRTVRIHFEISRATK